MRRLGTVTLAVGLALLAGCKDDGAAVRSGDPAATAETVAHAGLVTNVAPTLSR